LQAESWVNSAIRIPQSEIGSGRFCYLAGLDAAGTHFHPLGAALLELDPNGLQIRIKATRSSIVGVRDIIPELGPFSADIATFSHD
jgi:hypothetical protein